MESNKEQLLYSTFNCDNTCFCVGTNLGFRIYNSYPLKCLKKRDIDGGVSVISILNRCNVLAFVGTGDNIKFPPNKVILWDEEGAKVINEFVLRYNILNVKLKRTKIFLICESNIIVFSLGNYQKIDSIKTFSNKTGIFGICSDPKINIISYPSTDKGKIIIKKYDEKKEGEFITNEFKAHHTEIIALIMNYDGSLVASASVKGTIIRIIKTSNGDIIQELRRGTESAEIYCLSFDFNSTYIACSSNKGTIHIFNIKNDENNNEVQNQKSYFGSVMSFLGYQNQYLNSEWSFARYRLTCKEKSIVTFSPDNSSSVIVITSDGYYHQGAYDAKVGGEGSTSLEKNFLELEIEKDDD